MFKHLRELSLFDPLSGNWDCLLDQAKKDQLSVIFDGTDGNPTWDSMARNGMHSCDMVLDSDNDGLANFIEEGYGTNPTSTDSDNDRIDDIVEVSNSSVNCSLAWEKTVEYHYCSLSMGMLLL